MEPWKKQRSNFGEWLDRRGIKQQWIANKTGISHGAISQLASDNDRFPTFKNALKIEKALKGVDPSFNARQFWDI